MFDFQVPEHKKIRVILDSDTACEADDPFAIVHAMLSPKLIVKGITAEHFAQSGSMEKSFEKQKKLTRLLGSSVPVYRGQEGPGMDSDVSEGVQAIIREAEAEDEHQLFLLSMGALTNIARAFRAAPQIEERVTVVTIGGHAYDDTRVWREFNFGNDVEAANIVLASKAKVWQIPSNCYASVRVGIAELQDKVKPCGELGEYLFRQLADFNASPDAYWASGESWTLGDSPSVAVTIHPGCGQAISQNAYRVNEDTGYGEPIEGKPIRVYQSIDSRYLLEDFYAKLRLFAK